ncbi:MAG: LamG-like jellyroll fold domain-containing protein [Rhizomicrobium sp.]
MIGHVEPISWPDILSESSSDGTSFGWGFVPYTLTPGNWYYVTAVYSAVAGTVSMYVNGAPIGSASGLPNSVFDTPSPFQVGYLGVDLTDGEFDGHIDELGVWNRVLISLRLDAAKTIGLSARLELAGAAAAAAHIQDLNYFVGRWDVASKDPASGEVSDWWRDLGDHPFARLDR